MASPPTETDPPPKPEAGPPLKLTEEEAELIATLERLDGRKYREGEIRFALDQARDIGEL